MRPDRCIQLQWCLQSLTACQYTPPYNCNTCASPVLNHHLATTCCHLLELLCCLMFCQPQAGGKWPPPLLSLSALFYPMPFLSRQTSPYIFQNLLHNLHKDNFCFSKAKSQRRLRETRQADSTIYAFDGNIKMRHQDFKSIMKLVSKSLKRISIEPFARKDGKEQQKSTFTKIHSDDQVCWLVS